ncbi:MAG: dTDP-glucose 4,6-dehydratase [Candidatus Omnitrophica bacterium]|nr:dTDP-glucose 4,6-dehydratase [Candidatus Omnitrophota bacterium]
MSKSKSKILVTGGAGFIGSEFVRQAVKKGQKVVVIDKLTYAGDLERLKEIQGKYRFYKTDICQKAKLEAVIKKERPHKIVHFAAETHVDRSIQDALPFIQTNVTGTQNLIDLSRKYKVKKFVHISTDEVYGESLSGKFKETAALKPKNPYSATKTAAELLVRAAVKTYHFPAIIIRPANNYGPWQYPEKLIPVIILKALKNKKVPVYGKGRQIREWLHVADCAGGIHTIVRKGKIGEAYNIGTYFERENIATVKTILKLLGKPKSLIQFVTDRPGHDFRYSVSYTKIKKLGWKPKITFAAGIKQTVQWYLDHLAWMEKKLHILEAYWKNVYKEIRQLN